MNCPTPTVKRLRSRFRFTNAMRTEKLPEALDQAGFLRCLSMSPGDGICMTSFFHQGGTQIRLHVLSIDVEAFKLVSDEVCNPCSNDRIEDADPEHVAGDRDAEHFSRA